MTVVALTFQDFSGMIVYGQYPVWELYYYIAAHIRKAVINCV